MKNKFKIIPPLSLILLAVCFYFPNRTQANNTEESNVIASMQELEGPFGRRGKLVFDGGGGTCCVVHFFYNNCRRGPDACNPALKQ